MALIMLVSFPTYAASGTKAALDAAATRPIELTDKDHQTLARVERYLTALTSVKADFIQVSPSGDIAGGQFYMMRPGKLRMQYDPPTPVLMVTSGDQLIYYDYELKQVNQIALESTLVGFMARKDVKFDDSVKVVNLSYGQNSLRVTLIQTDNPRDGLLTLEFSDNPLEIRNMVVTDSGSQMTTVSLNNAEFDIPLDASLFTFKDPRIGGRKQNPNLPK